MTDGAGGVLAIRLRPQWLRLSIHDEDPEAGLIGTVASLDLRREESIERLTYSLRSVSAVAASLPPGNRDSSALVRNPASGRVDALLSIRVTSTVDGDYDRYLAAAQRPVGSDTVEVIKREVQELVVIGVRCVASHDFTLPIETEGVASPAQERTFLAMFSDDNSTCVEFALLTQDFALFVDSVSYLVAVAAGENPQTPGMDLE